jgi:hypothetical protein
MRWSKAGVWRGFSTRAESQQALGHIAIKFTTLILSSSAKWPKGRVFGGGIFANIDAFCSAG